jgi:hypothetical protein
MLRRLYCPEGALHYLIANNVECFCCIFKSHTVGFLAPYQYQLFIIRYFQLILLQLSPNRLDAQCREDLQVHISQVHVCARIRNQMGSGEVE